MAAEVCSSTEGGPPTLHARAEINALHLHSARSLRQAGRTSSFLLPGQQLYQLIPAPPRAPRQVFSADVTE